MLQEYSTIVIMPVRYELQCIIIECYVRISYIYYTMCVSMLHVYYINYKLFNVIQAEGDRINMRERRRHGSGRTEHDRAVSRYSCTRERGFAVVAVGYITTSCRASLSYGESRANQTWRFRRCLRCEHTVSSGVAAGSVARRRLSDSDIRLCHRALTNFGRYCEHGGA